MELLIKTDGGSRGNPGQAAVGVYCTNAQTQKVVFQKGVVIGIATNNEAEYRAFLLSLDWLKEFSAPEKITKITWQLDSKLVVEQLNKKWKIKEPRMLEYARHCWQKISELSYPYSIEHIPRALNADADALVNQALDTAQTTV